MAIFYIHTDFVGHEFLSIFDSYTEGLKKYILINNQRPLRSLPRQRNGNVFRYI